MMTESEIKAHDTSAVGSPSPHQRITDQMRALDKALATIEGWSDESGQARSYIIGQIEALKWASKLWEV
jgi:hypothetical protein